MKNVIEDLNKKLRGLQMHYNVSLKKLKEKDRLVEKYKAMALRVKGGRQNIKSKSTERSSVQPKLKIKQTQTPSSFTLTQEQTSFLSQNSELKKLRSEMRD